MRKILGPLLLGLGGFLLTTALLVLLWVPGQVKKTPLDVDSLTTLSGDASYLGSDRAPIKATSHSVIDGDASDGKTAVFQTFSCLMWNKDGNAPDCVSGEGEDSQLINAGTDAFATDRKTALAVSDQEKYLGNLATTHQGLINKFPFDVEQKTYPFWDGILDRAVDAVFVAEEKLDGLDTYKFNVNVKDEPAEIASGVQGKYSLDKTLWIDKATGSIIKQVEKQVRVTADGASALDLSMGFTDDQVAANIKDAKANGSKLGLIGTLPWIAGLLGLLSLLAGLVLNRDDERHAGETVRTRTVTPDLTPSAAAGATAAAPTRASARTAAPDAPTRPIATETVERTSRREGWDLGESARREGGEAERTVRRVDPDPTKE